MVSERRVVKAGLHNGFKQFPQSCTVMLAWTVQEIDPPHDPEMASKYLGK